MWAPTISHLFFSIIDNIYLVYIYCAQEKGINLVFGFKGQSQTYSDLISQEHHLIVIFIGVREKKCIIHESET